MLIVTSPYRFTADQYQKMGKVGILHEDDRIELIRGEIIVMDPMTPHHVWSVMLLINFLLRRAPDTVRVNPRCPFRLSNDSEPHPDAALIRPRRYWDALPTPEDVFVVTEVADTSQKYDREIKLPLYAAAGIPEAWLVDLADNAIERHTEPKGDIYTQIRRYRRGAVMESVAVPTLAVPVAEFLPPDEQ
jgi:Uma2 family endonuclease